MMNPLSGVRPLCMVVALSIVFVACDEVQGPTPGADVAVQLAVSGGFAGVDWQYTIDGARGEVIGDRCSGPVGCDWVAGQVLGTFTPGAFDALAAEFTARDFFEGQADYGSQCCDQFDYELTYREQDFDRAVRGSDGTLPANLLGLVAVVESFVTDVR